MLEARIAAISTQGPRHDTAAPGTTLAADSTHDDLIGSIILLRII